METMYILNVQNVFQNIFLVNPIDIYIIKETEKYVVGYEPKRHTFHWLVYKINKNLVSNIMFNKDSLIKIDRAVDINVKKILREFSDKWEFNVKNVVMRIIPTKYNNLQSNLQSLYGIIYQFHYRKTGGGGTDKLEFSIPECPTITNSNTINNICYKLVGKQISSGGTHQLHTYLLVAPSRGQYEIGNHIRISNINNGGNRNMHIYPVVITL